MNAVLLRESTGSHGTFGRLLLSPSQTFYTVELPWFFNERHISCIPCGNYTVVKHVSPTKGNCFKLLDVPNRSDILIHVANYGGDTTLGLKSDVEGCIGVGEGFEGLGPQKMITNSRIAMERLRTIAPDSFLLNITSICPEETFDDTRHSQNKLA